MRFPAVAGRFYPDEAGALRRSISECFAKGAGAPGPRSGGRRVSAVLVPHAGYVCSGYCASHAFRALAEDGRPEAYVIIGPDHYGVPYGSVTCSEGYATPFGTCHVDEGICGKLRGAVSDDPRAHAFEHSIEVEVPFLQYIDPDAKIVPVMMSRQTPQEAERLAGALRAACAGRDVVYVASSDLMHYVPKERADSLDREFLGAVASNDPSEVFDAVRRGRMSVCGYGPIAVAMMAARPSSVEILNQTDSSEALGYGCGSVVGYGSAVMYKRAGEPRGPPRVCVQILLRYLRLGS